MDSRRPYRATVARLELRCSDGGWALVGEGQRDYGASRSCAPLWTGGKADEGLRKMRMRAARKKKHGRYVSASACVLERAYVGMCSGEGVKKKRWQAEGAASMGAATVGCARDALYVHVDPAVESSEG